MTRALFVAATGQHVGKTTISLGIFSALLDKFSRVGFLKPVGQILDKTVSGELVDKDVLLFKEVFQLGTPASLMSPVTVGSGMTRHFIESDISPETLLSKIKTSYNALASNHDFVLVEGTGHMGVGSILGLSNAKVAKTLETELVLIARAGLGSAIDEIALNVALAKTEGVKIRGVILNYLQNEKREFIEETFPKALKHFSIPLLGAVPFSPFLSTPCIQDFIQLFSVPLLAGMDHLTRHFLHQRLVAGSLESYHDEQVTQELIITPASRADIIESVIEAHKEQDLKCGLILTGRRAPSPQILTLIKTANLPILYAPLCSYDAMKLITSFVAKTRKEDQFKIEQAITLVKQNLYHFISKL